MENKIAVIIGGGPAGLTAAYELLTTTGYIPLVIEMDKQVGGLSKTADYKGNKIDIGGHRFFSKSERVVNWWLHFLPLQHTDGEPVKISYQNKNAFVTPAGAPAATEKVMLLRPRKSRILFKKKFLDYPLNFSVDTIKNLGVIKLFTAGLSYCYARIFPVKDEKNLAQFFRNRFGNELYVSFFKDYTEKVWGVKCEDIPAEWGRQRIKDLSISKVLANAARAFFIKNKSLTQQGTSTSLIEQFMYPSYGPGQMWETVADEVVKGGGRIILNTEVVKIQFDAAGKIVAVAAKNCSDGSVEMITGDVFFSTMPVKFLLSNAEGVVVPQQVAAIAAGLQYRDFLIVGLLLDKLLLKDDGDNGKMIQDNWIYLQDKGIKAGRVQVFNNWSPLMVSDPAKVWIGVEFFCSETEAFWLQPDELIVKQCISEMKLTGLIDDRDVNDAVVIKVLKAYPSYHGTYDHFDEVKTFLNSIPNLYCIGRNGMHKYNNSDHSMLTAMEAVKHLTSGGDKNLIWNINTENDYHEEK